MGYRPRGGVLAAVGLIPVFAVGMGWIWTALGLVMRSPRAIMSIWVLAAAALLTAVFAPLTMRLYRNRG